MGLRYNSVANAAFIGFNWQALLSLCLPYFEYLILASVKFLRFLVSTQTSLNF